MNVIETHALSHRYGRLEALHELTLAVPAGASLALLGPNGAGKSTLLKLLIGLLPPCSGEARIFGVPSFRLRARDKARIGYVADGQDLPLDLNVRAFLDFCRPFYPTWDRELERELLRRFALPESRALRDLSRGMRMKAALLSALAYRPELLLLDEPFGGLDPAAREDLVGGLLEASAQGSWTIVLSSHDVEEVERLCDHVTILEQGRKRIDEPLDTLLGRFRRVEVEADAPFDANPAWLNFEVGAGRARFVDPAYAPGASEAAYAKQVPGGRFEITPLSLREIYLVLHRTGSAAPTPN